MKKGNKAIMKIEKINLNEDDTNVTLTTYLLDDSEEMLIGKSRPAVLICPGGGYMFTSDREAEPLALRFASMGYHAFVLRYSVFSNSGLAFPDPKKDDIYMNSTYPNPIREIGKALLIINEHAEEWKVRSDQIVLSGYSAGAHNCALYCVNWNKPVITDYFNSPQEGLKPAAAILGYGVYDFELQKDFKTESADEWQVKLNDAFNFAYFGKTKVTDDLILSSSPAQLVDKDTPPMFLWATREDNVVSVTQTTGMAHALAMKGIPFETHVYEKGHHGLSLSTQATAKSKEDIIHEVDNWIGLAETWLNNRFPLDLVEKTPIFNFEQLL